MVIFKRKNNCRNLTCFLGVSCRPKLHHCWSAHNAPLRCELENRNTDFLLYLFLSFLLFYFFSLYFLLCFSLLPSLSFFFLSLLFSHTFFSLSTVFFLSLVFSLFLCFFLSLTFYPEDVCKASVLKVKIIILKERCRAWKDQKGFYHSNLALRSNASVFKVADL